MFKELIEKANRHYGVIYVIKNMVNDKIYVGQTTNLKRRIKEYRITKLYKKSLQYSVMEDIIKYGYENFTFDILDTANTKDGLDYLEIYWIKRLNATNPAIGYNKKTGGRGGTMNEETIEKMRESSKKFRHTEETKIKKSIPIITYKDGRVSYYHGAKAFADIIELPRNNITRAAKNGLKAKGYYVFYDDFDLQEESLKVVLSKKRVNQEYIEILKHIREM